MQRQLTPEYEQTLVRRALEDVTSFSALYQAYIKRIYSYVFFRINNQHDAEDVVSAIFVKVFQNLNRYDKLQGSFSAWIFAITRNAIIDFLRKDRDGRISLEHIARLSADDISPEEVASQLEQSKYIREAISILADRRQEVVILKYFAGLRNKEIAEVLELDERTVASHLSRALDDLEDILKGVLHDAP